MESYLTYTETLERQLQLWEFWHTDEGAAWADVHTKVMREGKVAAPSSRDYRLSQIHTLENADPYYVSRPVCDLLENSMDSLPDAPLGTLTIPTVAGWVYFASPRMLSSALDEKISGFTWHLGGMVEPGVLPEVKEFTRVDIKDVEVNLDHLFIVFYKEVNGVLFPVSPMVWPFEDNWDSDWQGRKGSDEEHALLSRAHAYVFAFLAFIAQRLAATSITKAPRATRKRLANAHFPGEGLFKVVTLRAREASHTNQEPTPVDWSCRWIVRAHWRNQPYPSLGIYKPKLIPSHVQGPEDKPLKKPASSIFAVVR